MVKKPSGKARDRPGWQVTCTYARTNLWVQAAVRPPRNCLANARAQKLQIIRGESIPAQYLLWSGVSQELHVGMAFLQLISGRLALRHSNRVLSYGGAGVKTDSLKRACRAPSASLGPLQIFFASGTTPLSQTIVYVDSR